MAEIPDAVSYGTMVYFFLTLIGLALAFVAGLIGVASKDNVR